MPDHLTPSAVAPQRIPRSDIGELRRLQLIRATIEAIADVGFNAATIAEISRRADVSTGLIAFYFRDKDGLLEATLRYLARELARNVAEGMRQSSTPRARVQAVINATLNACQFDRGAGSVWLAFWGQVAHSPRFARVQRAYQRRTVDNLRYALRTVLDRQAASILAQTIAALIDGLWLRATLDGDTTGQQVRAAASAFVDNQFRLLGLTLK